jgi:hypothetical protein
MTNIHAPYRNPAANSIYHLLFADDLAAFAPRTGDPPAPWQTTLFGNPVAAHAVQALAEDATAEGRVRALAYEWLRGHGEAVAPRILLGAIVEVPLDNGLDVLAAYVDGGVRYLHHSGRMMFFEGTVPALQPYVRDVLAAAQAIVARIGPWEEPRRPPPQAGHVRLSFLVSDGLYFGEGPVETLSHDPLAGPLLARATALLQQVVALDAQGRPAAR